MIREKVKDHPDLVKVNKAFFINTNDNEYQRAIARRKELNDHLQARNRLNELEKKVDNIDVLLNKILDKLS